MLSKMSTRFKRVLSGFVIMALCLPNLSVQAISNEDLKMTAEDYSDVLDSYIDVISYEDYILDYTQAATPDDEIVIQASEYAQVSGMEPVIMTDFQGDQGDALWTDETGLITYEMSVEEAGLYNIGLTYYPVEGKNSAIQRAFFIDGLLPYRELANVEFDRLWQDRITEITTDNQGNDLKPAQIEVPNWLFGIVEDYQGYYTEAFKVYLEPGIHTLTMISVREPMVIKDIRFYQEAAIPTYETLVDEYKALGYQEATGETITIQAENSTMKSSQMLYPVVDHSSPAVEPYSAKNNKNNTIGGNNWRSAGQWIEWEVTVPYDGLYEIGLNVQQNFVRGIYTTRKLSIDGKVPFVEAGAIPFVYDSSWRVEMIGGETPYQFYLTEGTHTLRLEVVLGDLAPVMREMEETVRSLNEIYRRVLSVTGSSPDQYRDYQIKKTIPGLAEDLAYEKERITWILDTLQEMAGEVSDREAGLITILDQFDELMDDIEDMPKQLTQFKINVGSLGTWMTQAIEQPLQIDEIYIKAPSANTPKIKDSWWQKAIHEIKTLFYSFIIDYNAIGNVAQEGDDNVITVWIGTGRDQAKVMKSLIDEEFTKETGINVNLMLVDMATLLPATISGQGPDVAMQVTNDFPMNYGMRNAVADLSQFDGFDDVTSWFYDSAMVPYTFEDQCFGLPEQQTFNMLFYRKDILKELDLEVPKTWDDVKVALSVLSKNQMGFGLLPSGYAAGGMIVPPVSEAVFGMFLYQYGGEFYANNAMESGLDSDIAINAFKEFTEYYTDYGLEREFDIVNRFRTGEMPLVIANYTTYNTLQVSAPEIKGLWGFTEVPGMIQEDGSVKSEVAAEGTACIMMEQSENKQGAWEFMKWWVSADTQSNFGREMEGLMGAAARYPTANIEAFGKLPWPAEDYLALKEQFETVKGIPQVPGGYFTARHLNNAFYQVVVGTDIGPRESLTDYVRYIDDEITYKREEFGLTTNN